MGAKVTDTAAALVAEATARFARRQFAEAKDLCRKALAVSADTAEAWHVLGMIAIQELRDSEAIEMIARAVALAPGAGPAYANLGVAYQNIGNLAQAIVNFRQAATLTPRSAPVHVFLAHALLRAERWQEAAEAYAQALALGARGFELHGSYGQALRNLEQLPAAAEQFLRARKLNPKDPVAAVELGEVRLALGDYAGAVKALKDAAALLPHLPSVANNLGLAFKGMGSYPEAEAALQRAITLQPQLADAWLNLGGVRQAQERFDEALADYAKARSFGSRGAEALYNMATVHEAKGDLAGAVDLYRQALAEKPDYPDARRNKGLDQLKLGQLSEGWVDYAARWDCADYAAVRGRFSQRVWDGARDLDGALLVWGEQGLGDEILYGTMVPELLDAGMRIVRELDPRLVPLVQRSWSDMRAIARKPQPDPATLASDIAAQIPLGNLGRYLRANDTAFPAHPPFFKPDPARVAAFRTQLRPDGASSFVVGISWVSKNLEIGAQKSTSLADWSDVLQVPGVRFVNLQYGDTGRELTKVARTSGVSVQTLPNLDLTNDIDGLAALISACDLVVTVSNTTAHLAGALGVPAWVLVPTGNAKLWYWGQSGATTPWYPSLRLFRQVEPRTWDAPLATVAGALANEVVHDAGRAIMTAPPMNLADAQQLHSAGRATEAERAYAQILTADPSNGDAWFLFGALALETGRPAKAVDRLENAVKLNATSAPCFINLGLAYQGVAQFDKARKAFAQAVTLDPKLPEAHNSLGVALLALHKPDEAIAAFQRAIALRPQYPRAHYNLGNALRENGALGDAAASFTEAARLEPRLTQAHANLGVVLQELEDREGAEAAYQRALALNPNEPETLNNLGTLRRGALAFVEAQRLFEKAIAARPDFAEAHLNLGTAYQGQIRLDEAVAQYRRALALGAKSDAVFYNIGLATEYKGEFKDAIEAYRQSLENNPDYVEARWNKAILHLLSGEYAEGWREYECRFDPRRKKQPRGPFPQPRWDGRRDLPGALLVWAEQGLGDEVLYCRMAGELAAAGVDVVCEVDRRLMPLVNRSWPTMRTIPKSAPPDALTRSSGIAAQIPMGSLGGFMRPDLAAFAAAPAAYLRPDAARRDVYARRLRDGAPSSEIVVGISWASANRDLGPHKSVSLLDWAPILQQPGIRWVDLQYGETATERADAEAALGVKIEHMPDLDLFKDIEGLAALIDTCDLVITVSNTTAHLAAALGVPVWVLLPRGYGKLWYWGMRETTPWYPSARLFRQAMAGKWNEVVDAVAETLRANPRTAWHRVP